MSANEAVTPIWSASADAGRARDVLELAAAEVLPELVAADLVDEVDVETARRRRRPPTAMPLP